MTFTRSLRLVTCGDHAPCKDASHVVCQWLRVAFAALPSAFCFLPHTSFFNALITSFSFFILFHFMLCFLCTAYRRVKTTTKTYPAATACGRPDTSRGVTGCASNCVLHKKGACVRKCAAGRCHVALGVLLFFVHPLELRGLSTDQNSLIGAAVYAHGIVERLHRTRTNSVVAKNAVAGVTGGAYACTGKNKQRRRTPLLDLRADTIVVWHFFFVVCPVDV